MSNKKEASRTTKQASITLPINIYKKVKLISDLSPTANISATISKILIDFFENETYIKQTLELGQNSFLIPSHLYREVEKISPVGYNARVDRGDIKTITIGLNEFVEVSENSIKNVYLRVANFEKKLEAITLDMLEMSDRLDELNQETEENKEKKPKK